MNEQHGLTVAVRQWHEPILDEPDEARDEGSARRSKQPPRWPNGVLILNTETTTDRAQRLTFGWYRYAHWRPDGTLATVAEGIFHADDLPERDRHGYAHLQDYARTHVADLGNGHQDVIPLLSRRAFLNEVLWPAIQAGAHIVGFNLPFDLSCLAVAWGETRRKRKRSRTGMPAPDVFVRGFSLTLWEYQDKTTGKWR